MLIVLSILRDISKERKDLHKEVAHIIHKLLNELPLPKTNTEEPESKNSNNK